MAERIPQLPSLSVASDQPLIGLMVEEDGQEVVRYYVDEAEAETLRSQRR